MRTSTSLTVLLAMVAVLAMGSRAGAQLYYEDFESAGDGTTAVAALGWEQTVGGTATAMIEVDEPPYNAASPFDTAALYSHTNSGAEQNFVTAPPFVNPGEGPLILRFKAFGDSANNLGNNFVGLSVAGGNIWASTGFAVGVNSGSWAFDARPLGGSFAGLPGGDDAGLFDTAVDVEVVVDLDAGTIQATVAGATASATTGALAISGDATVLDRFTWMSDQRGGGQDIFGIDDIWVGVPEPGVASLLIGAGLLLTGRRRRA